MTIKGEPLAGKVALVTGGSRGIGAGISTKLAQWGCELCINYVQRDRAAHALAETLRAAGATVHLLRGDLAEPDEVERVISAVGDECGHLDILVDNAAIAVFRRLSAATLEHWQFVMDNNARPTLLLAQCARELMAGRDGRFITISNTMPERYVEGGGLLAAAKAALESLTRYLSVELAKDGIVVNCVRPGLVETDIVKTRPEYEAALATIAKRSPWGRATTTRDCGDVVAMLCLEEAGWICGQVIDVDGGTGVWL